MMNSCQGKTPMGHRNYSRVSVEPPFAIDSKPDVTKLTEAVNSFVQQAIPLCRERKRHFVAVSELYLPRCIRMFIKMGFCLAGSQLYKS